MELRYLVLCDKNGNKTEPLLQYYEGNWKDVKVVEMKTWEYTKQSND